MGIVLINNAYADLNVTVGIEMGYLDLLYFHARYWNLIGLAAV